MLLEIIVLDPVDAANAVDGGADRLELVSDMAVGGVSPRPATVAAVRAAAAGVPVRVMLRLPAGGFLAPDHTALRRLAKDLLAAGAEEFVLGFLDPAGALDAAALDAALGVLGGAPWTFHRAIDHAADRDAAWRALDGRPALDAVLTAGSPDGIPAGLAVLLDEAPDHRALLLAGGGLRESHLPALVGAGVTAFHCGSAVRPGRDWSAPVAPELVRRLRAALGRF